MKKLVIVPATILLIAVGCQVAQLQGLQATGG